MKIAYVISMKSGIPGFNYSEINELFKRGHEILLYPTKINNGPYMPKSEWYVHKWNKRKLLLFQLKCLLKNPLNYCKTLTEAIKCRSVIDFFLGGLFAENMMQNDIEHIHCHFGDHKFFIGYWCKKISGIPLTVTIHSHSLYVNPNYPMFKKALDYCDKIVTISSYNKSLLIDRFDVVPDKILVIRLFVDLEKYCPPRDITQEREGLRIFILGQFDARKGHEDLFEAVSLLNDKDIELWVAGGGSNSGKVIDMPELAMKFGIEDQVKIFTFPSEEKVIEMYQQCDVFCLPSKDAPDGNKEGIPVVLMEAMACGKAVISTIHAGIPELVDEILVEEGAVNDIRIALETLMMDEKKRLTLGEKNRVKIESEYSKDNLVDLVKLFIEK